MTHARSLVNAHSIEDLRQLARHRLPRSVFDFFDGGADDERTLRDNVEAFGRRRLRPKILVDVSSVDLSTEIAGARCAAPIVIAPTGALGAGWPRADLLIARAARKNGIPYTLSTTATSSIEQIAQEAGGRLWFQLYVLRDPGLNEALVRRARDSGYEALVLTLDLVTGGKRERDLRNRFTVPLKPSLGNLLDFAAHPAWCWQMLRHGPPEFANLQALAGARDSRLSVAAKVGNSLDASFDQAAFVRVRDAWDRLLIAKGVMRPEDAHRLIELGADAIWVSNHGGRQLDGCQASADALVDIVAAAAGRVPVIVDSGIRRGTDIVKALAMGAQAAAVGRATLFGVMAAGQAGAEHALAILTEELRRAMMLCGAPTVSALDRTLLAPLGPTPNA